MIFLLFSGSREGARKIFKDMESIPHFPSKTFPSLAQLVVEEKRDDTKTRQSWKMCKEVVGYIEKASILNTYAGMDDVDVIKNADLHVLGCGQKDVVDDICHGVIAAEDIYGACRYDAKYRDEWLRRMSEMGGRGINGVKIVDMRSPDRLT